MKSHLLPRRRLLAGMTALAVVAVTRATAAASESPTFYVSNSGTDDSDGRTPQTAWASIQKVNEQLPSQSTVLFRRGDNFYGELELAQGCDIGAYGAGAKPILTMFKVLNRPNGWVEDSRGVWRIDLGLPSTHDGYTGTTDSNIGFLVVDGIIKPNKMTRLSDLTEPWDFWSDSTSNALYVAASANPASIAANINAAPRGSNGRVIACNLGSNSIHDIHITGTGAHGITGIGTDVHIYNCLIDSVGGSYLPDYKDGTVRYGNGIENGVGAKRWLIERNEITQTYDVAYTCQGYVYDGTGTWEDMTIRNNHIHHCTQSFEFWSAGTNPAAGFRRVLVEGNVCQQAGFSDFAAVRPNQDNRVHLLTYEWELPADITIQDNTFDAAASAYTYQAVNPDGLITRDNTIRLSPGTKVSFQRDETIEQAKSWQDATGQEEGSKFAILP